MNSEKIGIPAAIVVAGLIIAGAVFASGYKGEMVSHTSNTSVSAQLGLNEKKMQSCIAASTYKDKIQKDTESGDRAMSVLPEDSRGTPYNVIIDTKTGITAQLAGAYPYDSFKAIIDGMLAGTEKGEKINLDPITGDDHLRGSKDAEIVIVEYGDMECPYCAAVNPTLEKILADYNGKVAWVFRHFPLSIHANAQVKAEAAECAWAQGGDKSFFEYTDKLYSNIMDAAQPKFDTTTL
jgi:protein-disulfide isomerase